MVRETEGNIDKTNCQNITLDDLNGEGSVESPYVVTSLCELQAVKQDLTANYILGSDIDAESTRTWYNHFGFRPIGRSKYQHGEPFTGFFDGNNHTIKNLTINRPFGNNIGLFGVIGPDGIVMDLNIENFRINGDFAVGGVAGYNKKGTLKNITINNSSIKGNNLVGGLVGWNYKKSIISNVNCERTLIFGEESIGGIVGENKGTLENVKSTLECSLGENKIGKYCGENRGQITTD